MSRRKRVEAPSSPSATVGLGFVGAEGNGHAKHAVLTKNDRSVKSVVAQNLPKCAVRPRTGGCAHPAPGMEAVNVALRLVTHVCRAARAARRNKAASKRLEERAAAFAAVLHDLAATRGGPTPRQLQGVRLLGRVLDDAATLLEKIDDRNKVCAPAPAPRPQNKAAAARSWRQRRRRPPAPSARRAAARWQASVVPDPC